MFSDETFDEADGETAATTSTAAAAAAAGQSAVDARYESPTTGRFHSGPSLDNRHTSLSEMIESMTSAQQHGWRSHTAFRL